MSSFRLETERLILREWRDEDREHFWAMTADAAMMRYLLPATRESSDAIVDRQIAHQAQHGHCNWVVERKSDSRVIGFCGITPPRPPTGERELAWRFKSDCWGQGYAREAALATLDWTWRSLETDLVVAITHPDNTRSWGLMRRLGMTYVEGGDFDHPDVSADDPLRRCVLYRITRPQ